MVKYGRLRLKCDGARAETRFRLSGKLTSPFKSAKASVHSTTGSRGVRISLQGLYYSCRPVFCSHVTLTGYPLHSLGSPSLLPPCVTVCHHISAGLYNRCTQIVTTIQKSPQHFRCQSGGQKRSSAIMTLKISDATVQKLFVRYLCTPVVRNLRLLKNAGKYLTK